MDRKLNSWFWGSALAFLWLFFSGCRGGGNGGSESPILEQKSGKASLEDVIVKPMARYREALGVEITFSVKIKEGARPYWVQVELLDTEGKPLPCAETLALGDRIQKKRDPLEELLEWNVVDSRPRFGADTMASQDNFIWISTATDTLGTLQMQAFIPYPWLGAKPGKWEGQLALKGYQGTFSGTRSTSAPDAVFRKKLNLDIPSLQRFRLHVPQFSLDTDQFNPHESDYVFLATKDHYGYPDPYWDIEIGEENVFRSPKIKNEVQGTFPLPTYPIWVEARNKEIRLCLLDWDEKRVLNGDDPMGCWKGSLSEISQDSTKPSHLHPGKVKDMTVWIEWLR